MLVLFHFGMLLTLFVDNDFQLNIRALALFGLQIVVLTALAIHKTIKRYRKYGRGYQTVNQN